MKQPHCIKVEQAAEILGIARNTAYEAVRRGQIPSIRIRKRILVPLSKLLRMIDADEDAAA